MNLFNTAFTRAVFKVEPITSKRLNELLEENMLRCECGGMKLIAVVTTNVTITNARYSPEFKSLSGVPKDITTSILQLSCATCGNILDPDSQEIASPQYCFWCGKPIAGLLFKGVQGRLYHHFCAELIGVEGTLVGE